MSTTKAKHVAPNGLRPGDRILGTDLVIAAGPAYHEATVGGDVERQRFRYTLRDGGTITYAGDSRPQVIRDSAAQRPAPSGCILGGAGGSDDWTRLVDPSAVPERAG